MGYFSISNDLAADSVKYGDDVAVLVVAGEIDYYASPKLRDATARQIKAGKRRLVLDLSTATFIDSTAIGVIVGAGWSLREAGGSLAVVCTDETDQVFTILQITGIEDLIPVYASREDALFAVTSTS